MRASGVALAVLIAWGVGITYLDGVLAEMMPYDQYETVALLYPSVFYPALPGWILAQFQPFSIGVWIVTIGWMIVLSVIIGLGATRYAFRRGSSPNYTAAAFVVALFVVVTVLEAAATLLM